MTELDRLLANNRDWSVRMRRDDPEFFARLAAAQAPKYLWIGCSDSRVPANQIIGLLPGEIFVHRNVANVVLHADLNCLSVLQFAVDVLAVEHVMVTGHYGCGGVAAALADRRLGLVDNWLRHVQDVQRKYETQLEATPAEGRHDRLCELNVIEQVHNVCQTTIVQDAWTRGQRLLVHGFIYSLDDGLLRDLHVSIGTASEVADRLRTAANSLPAT
ncbi:MAG: carbonate dehydratase [Planctomycetota bacterium]